MFKLASLLLLVTAGSAVASTIEYTFAGTGSGTVGTFTFSDVPITIEVLGNTLAVSKQGPGEYINPGITTLFIPGIGDVTVTDSTQMFSNIESGIGIGDNTANFAMFYLSPSDGYNLETDFGPLFNATPGAVDQFHSIRTTDGTLDMSLWENVTFTALVTPEPSTVALMLLGLGVLVWRTHSCVPCRDSSRHKVVGGVSP
jgi:hypothetical protein